jgi:hypothetical protein
MWVETCSFSKHQKLSCVDGISLRAWAKVLLKHTAEEYAYSNCAVALLYYGALLCASWMTTVRGGAVGWGTALQTRKVAGSISDGVTGIFQWLNRSGRIVALGSSEPRTEMSTRNPSWGLRRPVRRADSLTTFMYRLCRHSGASTSWNPKGLSRPVAGKALPLPLLS